MNNETKELVDKMKEIIKKGNVSKIVVKDKNDNTVVSFNMNIGVIGGLVALSAAPWAVITAGIVTAGTGSKVQLIKDTGEIIEFADAVDFASDKISDTAEEIKNSFHKRFGKW